MSIIRDLWQYAFSPRLYKILECNSRNEFIDKSYAPHILEIVADQIIDTFATVWSIRFCAVPCLMYYLYRRNSSFSDAYLASKFMFGAGVILFASFAARGYCRASNDTYRKFFKVLNEAKARLNYESKQELQKYDFEFYAWPVEYRAVSRENDKKLERISDLRARRLGNRDHLFAVPCKIASYITAHTVALRLIYPGCISFLYWMISSTVLQGRRNLIKQGGERFKLYTADNNEIDTIFVDRRKLCDKGKILVVTCEGNCGFYEVGIIPTPMDKGYSVLGWNHPGFANSTGAPYPEQEENGIDCVMQFAINKLGFQENEIIIYGWSIGGYTATFAAMNYPNIHSLILDATFDDLLPLAVSRMPPCLDRLVRNVIREYFNLNIAEQLNRYNGRVLLIRRTEDEIICAPTMNLSGNRGNNLLAKLFARRYPHIYSENSESSAVLSRFLAIPRAVSKKAMLLEYKINQNECDELVAEDILNNGIVYPSSLGEKLDNVMKQRLLLYLAIRYMKNQYSQHCTPLDSEFLELTWDPLSTLQHQHT